MPAPAAIAVAGSAGGGAGAGGAAAGGAAGGGAAGGAGAGGAGGGKAAAGAKGGAQQQAHGGQKPWGGQAQEGLGQQQGGGQGQTLDRLRRRLAEEALEALQRRLLQDALDGRRLRQAAAGVLLLFLAVIILAAAMALVPLRLLQPPDIDIDLGITLGIPAAAKPFVPIYQDAARVYGVNPYLLMAVHEDETNFSTCTVDGCPSRHGTTNPSGAGGAMQFLTTTWPGYADAYKKARLGRGEVRYPHAYGPHPDRWDDYDAIYAAAAYFHGLGAGTHLDHRTYLALLRYKGTPPGSIPFATHDYKRALELAAAGTVSQVVGAGNLKPEQFTGTPLERIKAAATAIGAQKLPYCWSGGHGPRPGPSRGTSYCVDEGHRHRLDLITKGLDCSGSTRWLLYLAGFPDPGPTHSSQFLYKYPRGRGEHVTIWSNDGHVFVEIDGRFWSTSSGHFRNGPDWGYNGWDSSYHASHPPGL